MKVKSSSRFPESATKIETLKPPVMSQCKSMTRRIRREARDVPDDTAQVTNRDHSDQDKFAQIQYALTSLS